MDVPLRMRVYLCELPATEDVGVCSVIRYTPSPDHLRQEISVKRLPKEDTSGEIGVR